ncbi:hypothetical protein [Geminocystis sp. NIES-3708]|uniref:hypothetical protein n=1 Tax=Geminocystis sp. NIES-3708 TaxID=1615909 RepID=UPI00082BDFFD|nr:hypothetical protein [Geminocystis sp. NIES-3708]
MTSIYKVWRVKSLKNFIFFLAILTFSYLSQYLSFLPGQLFENNYSYFSPVFAQTITPEKVAEEVYQQIPDFPLENNYISRETNQIAIENTLISRLVRYHQYTKSRPTTFRLDWKLTLADYLGKNETINDERYPGSSTLTQNPFISDRKIIQSLTMQQRNDLVNVLVSIYNPNVENKPQETPTQNPQNNNSSPTFVLPQPGGADLLLP